MFLVFFCRLVWLGAGWGLRFALVRSQFRLAGAGGPFLGSPSFGVGQLGVFCRSVFVVVFLLLLRTQKAFAARFFCSAQLAYCIATTCKSTRTCVAHVHSACGPLWARDGLHSISSAVTAGDDEAPLTLGRVWDHKKLSALGLLLWSASLYHIKFISAERKLLVLTEAHIVARDTNL